ECQSAPGGWAALRWSCRFKTNKAAYTRTRRPPGPSSAGNLRPLCPQPAEATPSPGIVCGPPPLTVVWVDLTMAGSSFLSPKPQNARALQGWLSPELRSQVEGAENELENELEISFNALLDVGIKLSGAQFHQHGQTLGKFLQEVLWEEVNEASADK
ncbi:hypothetical protein E2I00_009111, partial [Balaenoptera physalus]